MAKTTTKRKEKSKTKASVPAAKPKKSDKAAKGAKVVDIKTRKEREVTEEETEFSLQKVYGKQLDSLEKEYNLTSGEIDIPGKLSTRTLNLDLLSSGGFMSGTMTMWSGVEQGSKTTATLTTVGHAIDTGVPVVIVYDAENAISDHKYASALLRRDASEIFEGENKLARLYRKSVLEPFFNYCRALMRSCPDKIYRSDRKAWYFVFDATKDGRALMDAFGYKEYDKELYRITGRLWCQTDKKGLQGFIACDSFAALIPTSIDEKDSGGGRAAVARAYSESLVKVMGILKEKAFALLGTHQVREKPEASYGHGGPTYYENGGNALKFNSSSRIRFFIRSVPEKMGFTKGIGENGYPASDFGTEPSFYGDDLDRYHYIYTKNTKNKLGIPKLEGWMRVWVKDGEGEPHGYCPAFDTFEYLRRTGRIEKVVLRGKNSNKKDGFAFSIKLDSMRDKIWQWQQFKLLILASEDKKLAKDAKSELGGRIIDIRKDLFKEIRTKKAYKLIQKNMKKLAEKADDDDEAEDLEA